MRGTRLWIVASLVGGLALAGAGCGSSDNSGSTGASTSGGTSAQLDLLTPGTLTVGSDIPYAPFEQGDAPNYEGFDIDLINAVADEMGLQTKIVDAPFDVILAGTPGRFDLSIAATTIKPGRENHVDFSNPYFEASQSLLVQKGGDIKSIDDLTSDSVVGAEDGTTGETYAQDNTDASVQPYPEIDDAYNALHNGQVDAVLNDLPATTAAVEHDPSLAVVQTFETHEFYGIVFPQEADALREAVNAALQTVKDNGTLDSVYQDWFGTPVPKDLLTATHKPT